MESIAQQNGIRNVNRIYPGQVLEIADVRTEAPVVLSPPGRVAHEGEGLSVDQLTAIMPNLTRARALHLLPELNAAMAEAGINTPRRQAAFVAQLAHESVGLTHFQ